jgi:hypothetical protein
MRAILAAFISCLVGLLYIEAGKLHSRQPGASPSGVNMQN